MEAIRQNGKIILHSNDGISIKMIFRNLTGRNFQGQEYADYISHIAIGSMGFTRHRAQSDNGVREGEEYSRGHLPSSGFRHPDWPGLKAAVRAVFLCPWIPLPTAVQRCSLHKDCEQGMQQGICGLSPV